MSELIDIQAIHVFRLSMPLKKSYAVAYDSYDKVENIVVSIDTDTGIVGWGCASPDEKVTGETVDGTLESIREKIAPALIEAPPAPLNKIIHSLSEIAPVSPAARAAIDIALHDMWGKRFGISLTSLIGGFRNEIPTSVTIGICDSQTCSDAARDLVEHGFRILKLKCGRNPDEDIDRVKAIKRELGRSIKIRLDANQGYSVDQAKKVVEALTREVEFIEQPIDAKDREGLCALAAESPVPIMADEAALSAADAMELFQKGVPLINVKLMKSGGIAEAMRICDIAHVLGKKVMIGCMDEIPLSMAAAAAVALSHPAVEFADLDGHIDLDQRFAASGIIVNNGIVSVTSRPGLGVEIRKKYLRESEVG